MNKQRLMLSAAMAALLAGAAAHGVRADTDVTTDTKSAATTTTDGNITIETNGQIDIKASTPAVTINSNNFLSNARAPSATSIHQPPPASWLIPAPAIW